VSDNATQRRGREALAALIDPHPDPRWRAAGASESWCDRLAFVEASEGASLIWDSKHRPRAFAVRCATVHGERGPRRGRGRPGESEQHLRKPEQRPCEGSPAVLLPLAGGGWVALYRAEQRVEQTRRTFRRPLIVVTPEGVRIADDPRGRPLTETPAGVTGWPESVRLDAEPFGDERPVWCAGCTDVRRFDHSWFAAAARGTYVGLALPRYDVPMV